VTKARKDRLGMIYYDYTETWKYSLLIIDFRP
jgi:hypothetical protein